MAPALFAYGFGVELNEPETLEVGKSEVLEEGAVMGGIGEAIGALAHGWHGPFANMGMPDVFPARGTQAEVRHDLSLDKENITACLRKLFDTV